MTVFLTPTLEPIVGRSLFVAKAPLSSLPKSSWTLPQNHLMKSQDDRSTQVFGLCGSFDSAYLVILHAAKRSGSKQCMKMSEQVSFCAGRRYIFPA